LRALAIVLAADAIWRARDRAALRDAAKSLDRGEKFEVFLLEPFPARRVKLLP
jgi:hypothetical protein